MQMSLQRCLRRCDLDVLDRYRVRIIFTLVGRVVAHDNEALLLGIYITWLKGAGKGEDVA